MEARSIDSVVITESEYRLPYFTEEEIDHVEDVVIEEIYISRQTPILDENNQEGIEIEVVNIERITPRYW